MAFDAVVTASIKTTDGRSLESLSTVTALKAQEFIERELSAGTHDLSPHLANFTNLKVVLVEALDSEFLLSIDGTNFGPRKHKVALLTVTDAGTQPLMITLSGQSRVRLAAVGV
jgi:hypothetical protein